MPTRTTSDVGRRAGGRRRDARAAARGRCRAASRSRARCRRRTSGRRGSAVTSRSSTISSSAKWSAASEPISYMSGSRMIPSCSSDSCSSRSDSIIPSDTSPRSLAWRSGSGAPGSTAPGSATTTVSPVTKFEAPQTIWRGSPSPTSTWHSRRRSAFGCLPNSTTRPILKLPWFAALVGRAARDDAVDLEPGQHETLRQLGQRQVERDVVAQPGDGDLHEGNCSRNRRSLS